MLIIIFHIVGVWVQTILAEKLSSNLCYTKTWTNYYCSINFHRGAVTIEESLCRLHKEHMVQYEKLSK